MKNTATIKSASFSGVSSNSSTSNNSNGDLSNLHNDQYQQFIQKQQQQQQPIQIQAQSIGAQSTNGNNNGQLYPTGANFQSYMISPSPYQQQQQNQHTQFNTNGSQPNSANSQQLHFYDDNNNNGNKFSTSSAQHQQGSILHHGGSISEQSIIGGIPPQQHQLATPTSHPGIHPNGNNSQPQFLFNGNNYSTSLPIQQLNNHPAGSGEYSSGATNNTNNGFISGTSGYDSRYVYTTNGGILQQQQQPGQQQQQQQQAVVNGVIQHYDGFNGNIHQPPQ